MKFDYEALLKWRLRGKNWNTCSCTCLSFAALRL